MFDLSNLLATGPVASLAARAGINITERLATAKSHKFWDDRVTLIDDDNYGDLIVNETLTKEEEKDRLWFVVMYVLCCLSIFKLMPKPNVQNCGGFRARGCLKICGPSLRLCVQLDTGGRRFAQCTMGSYQLPERHYAHDKVECLVVCLLFPVPMIGQS